MGYSPDKFMVIAASINGQLLVYRRAIKPTIPARRPAAGLTLEAAPVKGTLEELALGGWDSAGWDAAGCDSAGRDSAGWDAAGWDAAAWDAAA